MGKAAAIKVCMELSPRLLHTTVNMHVPLCARDGYPGYMDNPKLPSFTASQLRLTRPAAVCKLPYTYISPYKNGYWQDFIQTIKMEEATEDLSQPGFQLQEHYSSLPQSGTELHQGETSALPWPQ